MQENGPRARLAEFFTQSFTNQSSSCVVIFEKQAKKISIGQSPITKEVGIITRKYFSKKIAENFVIQKMCVTLQPL